MNDKRLWIQRSCLQTLMEWYQGNPLMLKCVASLICDLYDRDIAAFLAEEALLFQDIPDLIAQQLDRLNPLERQIMIWLATHPTPQTMTQLQAEFLPSVSPVQLRDALALLDRRSLIEKTSANAATQKNHRSPSYRQQPVIREYVLERSNDRTAQDKNETIDSLKVLAMPERNSRSLAQTEML